MAIPSGERETQSISQTRQTQTTNLETQLEYVLSAMEGVGEVKVMIATEHTQATLFGSENGEGTVVGVVVVAQGAGNPVVDARISEAIKALFSIDVHKISIVKMTNQEDEQ